MGTGWKPPAFLLRDPSWNANGRVHWEEITSGGVGQPETIASNDLGAGNRAIVADLVHAIESDTQPRASGEDGRASIEMILACYASQVRGGPVDLPLSERSEHPLAALRRPAGGGS
jgi:predicted dehydrogenase